jgi:hypothetical protein
MVMTASPSSPEPTGSGEARRDASLDGAAVEPRPAPRAGRDRSSALRWPRLLRNPVGDTADVERAPVPAGYPDGGGALPQRLPS